MDEYRKTANIREKLILNRKSKSEYRNRAKQVKRDH
jgi:hypothetical protein